MPSKTSVLPTRAMLLAAGEGRRLRPLTERQPKCLLEAGGRPLLEWALERLVEAGVTEVTINIHHLADKVVDYLKIQPFPELKINLSREEQLLDTGGGLYKARNYFSGTEPFYVYNADVYTELDLTQPAQLLTDESVLGVLVVAQRNSPRRLLFDAQGYLVGWENQNSGEQILAREAGGELIAWNFNGIQVLQPEIFDYMRDMGSTFSLIQTYLKAVAAGARIKAFPLKNTFWADVGTPARLAALRSYLNSRTQPQ